MKITPSLFWYCDSCQRVEDSALSPKELGAREACRCGGTLQLVAWSPLRGACMQGLGIYAAAKGAFSAADHDRVDAAMCRALGDPNEDDDAERTALNAILASLDFEREERDPLVLAALAEAETVNETDSADWQSALLALIPKVQKAHNEHTRGNPDEATALVGEAIGVLLACRRRLHA